METSIHVHVVVGFHAIIVAVFLAQNSPDRSRSKCDDAACACAKVRGNLFALMRMAFENADLHV